MAATALQERLIFPECGCIESAHLQKGFAPSPSRCLRFVAGLPVAALVADPLGETGWHRYERMPVAIAHLEQQHALRRIAAAVWAGAQPAQPAPTLMQSLVAVPAR